MRFPFICCGIALVLLVHLRMTGWLMKTISSSIYEQNEEVTHADDRLELVTLVNSLLKHLLKLEGIDFQDDFPQQQYYNYSDTEHLNDTEHDSDPPTTKIPNKHNYINCSTGEDNKYLANQTISGQEETSLRRCQPIIPEKPIEDCPLMTENKPSESTCPVKTANDQNVDNINKPGDQTSVCLACEVCEFCSGNCEKSNCCDRCPDDCKSCDKTCGIICSPECNMGYGKQLCKVSTCNPCKNCEKSYVCNRPYKDCQLSSHIHCGDICKLGCKKCQPLKFPTCNTNTYSSCFDSCTKPDVCDSPGKDFQSNYDICNLGCNRCPTCNHAECLDNRIKNNICKRPVNHCELSRYNNDGVSCNPGRNRYHNQPLKCPPCNICDECFDDHRDNIYDLPGNKCQPPCHKNYGDICNSGCDRCHSQSFKRLTCNAQRNCLSSCKECNVCPTPNKNCQPFIQPNYESCNQPFKCPKYNGRKNNCDRPNNYCQASNGKSNVVICNLDCNRCYNQPLAKESNGCDKQGYTRQSSNDKNYDEFCNPTGPCHSLKCPSYNMQDECLGSFGSGNGSGMGFNDCQPLCNQNYDICNPACNPWGHNNPIPLCPSNAHRSVCSNLPSKHMVPCNHRTCNKARNLNCFVAPIVPCIPPVCHPVCKGCHQPSMQPCCRQPSIQPRCRQSWNQRDCCKGPCMPGLTWNRFNHPKPYC